MGVRVIAKGSRPKKKGLPKMKKPTVKKKVKKVGKY
jgi:hypothetical protein